MGGGDGGDLPVLPPTELRCDAGAGEAPCGRIGCHARCGEGCECAAGTTCVAPGICVPRDEEDARCEIPRVGFDLYCERGGPCAGRESSDGVFRGACVDVGFCLAAGEAAVDFECRWYDGSSFEDGPPPGSCPPQDPRDPFCGGACPEIDCAAVLGSTAPRETAADCVGLSERRAFGLCRLSGFLCERPSPGASPTPDSSACE